MTVYTRKFTANRFINFLGLKRCNVLSRLRVHTLIVSLWTVLLVFWVNPCESQIKVLSPASLVTAVQKASDDSDVVLGTTATFGVPTYGESFIGKLFFKDSNYCTEEKPTEPAKSPELKPAEGNATATTEASVDGLRQIHLVQRGTCTFVTKVTNAEKLQADAVIFVDSPDSPWTRKEMGMVIIADDGYGRNVRIPSVMVTKEDGKLLVDAVKDAAAKDAVKAASGEAVIVQLQWSLPQKSIVTMDFWTESASTAAQQFLKDYAFHANVLRGHLRFNPRYAVYGLKTSTPDDLIKKLCFRGNAELCSSPPNVLGSQVTGADVLEEDIRQLCLWKHLAKEVDGITDSMYSSEWWEYVRKFADSCPVSPRSPTSPRFGTECSYTVMATIPGIDEKKVKDCADTEAPKLLQEQKDNRAWGNLALRLNGAKFSGALDAMQVSKAVCSAFETPPPACVTLTEKEHQSNSVGVAGFSLRTLLMSFIILALCTGLGLYLYQQYMRKSMRDALRHEVMLEVRSQLQEYHQLEEADDSTVRHKHPLMTSYK